MLDPDAWYNKGLALKAAGRYPEADQALLTALELRGL
jgi:Flp pilus assembly protein TadD